MKKRISIGIPAYNEQKNIRNILADVYSQDLAKYTLHEVIVFSDGSTDNTVAVTKSLKYPKLQVIDSTQRKGMVAGLNALCKASTGDCLVLLNADMRIKDAQCIQKLALPVLSGVAALTSCNQVPVSPISLVEQALCTSVEIKNAVFENYKDGDNIYTCHGTARALSNELYKKIYFPHSVGEDAYAYLFATYNKMKYNYVKNTQVYYKLPSNLDDHHKQTMRFAQSKTKYISEFGEEFMKGQYDLPPSMIIKETLRKAVTQPFSTLLFITIFVWMKLRTTTDAPVGDTWDIATTSKEIK